MKCETKNCRKQAKQGAKCYSCVKEAYKKKDPVKYAYLVLRNNAKRRNKEFTITLEYFREFCYKTEYMNGRGRGAESYHIDRIDDAKGYVPGNIQVLTNRDNVQKYIYYDVDTRGKPSAFKTRKSLNYTSESDPNYPF